ncbi:MAG: hypothetical protein QM638_17870 [Nocardioides sp.]|uniref:hypothetical protein n=1 Tax=Nocardioides sp. TaxID=35761 RepID=UPI0039E41176
MRTGAKTGATGRRRPVSWWARALRRTAEEVAEDQRALAVGARLRRSGRVQVVVSAGSFAGSVAPSTAPSAAESGDVVTLLGQVPVLTAEAVAGFLEAVSFDPARIAAVRRGELPYDLIEHAEEAGVELIPAADEIASTCSCGHWRPGCVHLVAVLLVLAEQAGADARVLLRLRGVPVDEDRSGSAAIGAGPEGAADAAGDQRADLELAVEATLRARALLADAPEPSPSSATPPAPH